MRDLYCILNPRQAQRQRSAGESAGRDAWRVRHVPDISDRGVLGYLSSGTVQYRLAGSVLSACLHMACRSGIKAASAWLLACDTLVLAIWRRLLRPPRVCA